MTYRYQRRYSGPVRAVILDWAGTTVDFGSLAPVTAFCELFARHGVAISSAEARGPMGSEKREHIRQLLAAPRIASAWHARNGAIDAAGIDALYAEFIPLQLAVLEASGVPVPGALEAIGALRERGIAIGANTGYSREMLDIVARVAAHHGYRPDSNVCATEVPRGRPWPHMSLKNAIELGVDCVQACVKVDDTVPGIEEGLNAGMWTVAVAVSGNELGLDLPSWDALAEAEQQRLAAAARNRLARCGAHYVIDSIAELPAVVADIDARLGRGEQP